MALKWSSTPPPTPLPFVSLSVIAELFVFIFYRGWGHFPYRAAWITADRPGNHRPFGALISVPSCTVTNPSKLWVFISQLPDIHLFRIVLILLPCPVYSPCSAHNSLCWYQVVTCIRDVSICRTPGSSVSLVLLLLLTQWTPWRLDVAGELKEYQNWCRRSGFLSLLCHIWWAPTCSSVKWGHNTKLTLQLWCWMRWPLKSVLMHNKCNFPPNLPILDAFCLPLWAVLSI